jgi:prepilin-type N-terminal cleavage/methylation domain-containing protein
MSFMNHNAGFSLVEVMIAIVILGIALVGLTQGITTALGSSKESELQTTGALFAAGQIELLRAEKDLTDGTTDGDCGASLPLYRWKQTISPTDVAGLHDVDVVIENSQTGAEIYELETLLFEPPEGASGKPKDAKSKTQTP